MPSAGSIFLKFFCFVLCVCFFYFTPQALRVIGSPFPEFLVAAADELSDPNLTPFPTPRSTPRGPLLQPILCNPQVS